MLNRLNSFVEKIPCNAFLKYVALVGTLCMTFGLVYAGFCFARANHEVEIDMISDHEGVSQLFWLADNERYSELASMRYGIKPGNNHLGFVLPFSAHTRLRQLRFDPTEKDKGTFEITRIRYINGRKGVFNLPLVRLSKTPKGGISITDISDEKVCMVSQNRDPSIIIKMQDLERIGSLNKATPYMLLLILSLIFWITGLHGMQGVWGGIYPNLYKVVPILAKIMYSVLFVLYICYLYRTTALLGKVTCAVLLLYGIKYLCFREWKKEKKPEVAKAHFDWGMHYFRALAIACICLGHTFSGAGKESWGWMFFQADSIYFLFISGYLAQFLFFKKPDPPLVYYKKKVINIILPYIVFSSIILTFLYFTHPRAGLYNKPFTPKNIALAFCFGRAAVAYWYIPFVVILFLGTPLLVRLSSKHFIQVLFTFGSIAIVFPQRGGFANLEFFCYLYTYFTFSYLLGMAFSRYREPMETFFQKNWLYSLLLAVGIGILIGWNPSWKLQISVLGLLCSFQKILFTIFFIVMLSFLKDKKIRVLSYLAEFSFTIYFIHLIFYEDYREFYNSVTSYTGLGNVNAFITGCVFLLHMLFLSILLKKILGKYSRYFIGT